jgi:UDP-N-acetylmuramoylalanine--D-glutamate ligase
MDVPQMAIASALKTYRPLPHRMEIVRVREGVAFINDSKATNVDAAVKSLKSIEGTVVMVLGGRDKKGDFEKIREGATNIRMAVLIGEASATIESVLAGACPTARAQDMPGAVNAAAAAAEPGDTVLLAPACASFDMFSSYEERGEVFRDCVHSLN